MNRIRVLTENTVNKIAAGEVIERPASVVKELIENSIDAAATEIIVEVKSGGKTLIRISDNGIGMSRDDAILCLERHSTSKIRDADDLEKVTTMGFRGEAMPSIASISKFSIITCQKDESIGTFVKVDGGRTVNVVEVGRSPGTTIEVKSLFFNVPARRKYMRSVEREMAEIARTMDIYALANPKIHFHLIHNGRTLMLAPCTEKISDRIMTIFGKQFFMQLIYLDFKGKVSAMEGYIGKPELTRSSRSHQFIYVNKRPIISPPISYAITEAYKNILMKDRYPVFILFLKVNPDTVDVNVHPAKREIRFKNEWEIKDEITKAAKAMLQKIDLTPDIKPGLSVENAKIQKTGFEKELYSEEKNLFAPNQSFRKEDSSFVPPYVQKNTAPSPGLINTSDEHENAHSAKMATERKDLRLRYLGQLKESYILAEDDEGLVLIDQHAAHERVLYERLSQIIEGVAVRSQRMLVPVTIELSSGDAILLEANIPFFRRLGFELRPFGNNTFIIEAVPEYVKTAIQEKVIRDAIDMIKQDKHFKSTDRDEAVLYAVCHAAVKAYDILTETEVLGLIRDLNLCNSPYTCPHGRPTMLRMKMNDIEKHFKRR